MVQRMSSAQVSIDISMFAEYADQIEALSTALAGGRDGAIASSVLLEFASLLGVGDDLAAILDVEASRRLDVERLALSHFSNNVELLIQKTWIEKSDEAHREELLDLLPRIVEDMRSGRYAKALEDFLPFADDLAYLLFGAESRKGDFIEYVGRIDPFLGLFWLFADMVSGCVRTGCDEFARGLMLVCVVYLASF